MDNKKTMKALGVLMLIYGIICIVLGSTSVIELIAKFAIYEFQDGQEFSFLDNIFDLLFLFLIPGILYLIGKNKLRKYGHVKYKLLLYASIMAIIASIVFSCFEFRIMEPELCGNDNFRDTSIFYSAIHYFLYISRGLLFCAIPIIIIIKLSKIKKNQIAS